MKNKFHVVVTLSVLAVAVTVVAFAARSSRGQSSRQNRNASAKPAVRVTDSGAAKPSAFTAAAGQNAVFRNELNWTFGGKQQRGWYLYDLLIGKTLDTNDDALTADFAEEVAAWQKKRGLRADGVLDEDALMALVSQWQSARLKNRAPAQPDRRQTFTIRADQPNFARWSAMRTQHTKTCLPLLPRISNSRRRRST
jgi:murein L,D-transpeptidase YcbB/YkuD